MVKKVKSKRARPMWGWKDARLQRGRTPEPATIYTPDVVKQICPEVVKRIGNADREMLDRLRHKLINAACLYIDLKAGFDDSPRFSEIHAALDALGELCEPLCDRLYHLDDSTRSYLCGASNGYVFAMDKDRWDRLDTAIDGVQRLTDYIAFAKERLPIDKGGRPLEQALTIWVCEIAEIWERELGQDFTIDFHKNEPTSAAAYFLTSALTTLDPDALEHLPHAIRKAQAHRRQKKTSPK